MRFILISLSLLSLSACATAPVAPRPASNASFSTQKNQDAVMKAVAQALSQKGFAIKSANKDIGMLTTEPRGFNVSRGVLGVQWPARATAQVGVQDKSVSLTITYECSTGNMLNGTVSFSHCNSADTEAASAIESQEKEISSIVQSAI